MNTKYMKRGNSYHVVNTANLNLEPLLPVGTYGVVQDPETGEIFLETIEDFPPLGKLYGDASAKANRIWNTFTSRAASTGVLLTGEKGCGKTMLAKLLSEIGRDLGVPTIVVNKPFHGEGFNQFVQSITQECVVIFDEYEKVYEESKHQNMLLTLFDGVFPTKKLFILTTNDRFGVNNKMLNRPGRMFYAIEYKGLGEEFVREYCADKLKRKEDTEGVVAYSKLFENFNFDMLKALVEEMNRYNENAREASAMMNMKIESWQRMMDAKVMVNGKEATSSLEKSLLLDPANGVSFDLYETIEEEKRGDGWYTAMSMEDLISIRNDIYTYEKMIKLPVTAGSDPLAEPVMESKRVTVVLTPAIHGRKSYEELALAS